MSAARDRGPVVPPPDAAPPSLDDALEMAFVARRHYVDGRTRVQIADELGLSRFKVARLLESAISSGVVRIEITVPEAVDTELSMRLRTTFGLRQALVVSPADPRPETVRDALGRAAARLMMDTVTADDVLGMASGRTIDAMTRHLRELPTCEVVQLTGMSGDLNENSVDVVRRVSGATRGRVSTMYAPMTVASEAAASALRAEPSIASASQRFSRVTKAYVAVGSWRPPDSRFYDGLPEADRAEMLRIGVTADVGGRLLAADGAHVDALDHRVIGIGLDQLRDVASVVVVGGGLKKAGAVRSVLLSGVASTLVTDDAVAERLLRSA